MKSRIVCTLVISFFVALTALVPTTALSCGHMQKTDNENEAVDRWIQDNGLNRYGDPMNTTYIGGTPLFDEKTGKSIDRYDYIQKNHPDKPWLKQQKSNNYLFEQKNDSFLGARPKC